jgi:lysine 6-dehydrogenase
MRVLILGHGNIGSVVVRDLTENAPSTFVAIADKRRHKPKDARTSIDKKNISWIQLDVSDYSRTVEIIKGFDLVIGALPGALGFQSARACIDAKVNMVDVSFMSQNPLELNEDAVKAGITIIPDCGVAPGLSNLLVGHAASKLDRIENVHIMVGGLPEKLVPPLDYTLTWSAEGLIDEYTRKVKIVENGQVVEVEALSGLENVEFPEVGKLEAFYTDGLRTLIYTVRKAESMWEKTLRYPGHVEKIRLLKSLGFFDEEPVKVERASVSPRKVTVRLLEKNLRKPEIKDILAMKVEVSGTKRKRKTSYVYYLIDRYDKEQKVTAMARTTAYTTSIIAQLMGQGVIEEKGVIPLERIASNQDNFRRTMAELERRQIRI